MNKQLSTYTFEGRTVEVKQLNRPYDGYVYVYGMQSADANYIQGRITLEQRDSAHAYLKSLQDLYPEQYKQYGW